MGPLKFSVDNGRALVESKTMKSARLAMSLAFVLLAYGSPAHAEDKDKRPLSAEAMQVSHEIGTDALLQQLSESRRGQGSVTIEQLTLRQQVSEQIMAASLQIDSVNALIDYEVEEIRSLRSDLQSQRDRGQNIINLSSLITGGVSGVTGTALQFSSKTANIGNGVGVTGGATSLLLSLIGIHKQGGGRRPLGDTPRMLAAFLGHPVEAHEVFPSGYPEPLWEYLNSPWPDRPQEGTRKEQLMQKWKREGRIEQQPSAKEDRKATFLSSNMAGARKLNIDDLNDRVAMLEDIRAILSLMKRDLTEIMLHLSRAD